MRCATLVVTLVSLVASAATDADVTSADAAALASIRRDPLRDDPSLEVVHLYRGQWPTGVAVSAAGRKFSCYPAGLDSLNTNNGSNGVFQVAELKGLYQERAYPNASYNSPPGGAIDRSVSPPVTKGLSNFLLGVQSVVVDQKDILWLLDSGRVQDPQDATSPMLPSTPGGPKLVAVDLKTNTVTRTIVFPADVALPESYLNDVRFDYVNYYAYITDSSPQGENAIVVVDLLTERSFRRLTSKKSRTQPIPETVPWVYGNPLYSVMTLDQPVQPGYQTFGSDGIAISPDTKTLYFTAIAGRFLYSIPTANLRDSSRGAEARANAAVLNLGEKGESDGLETDSNGIVYAGQAEQDGIAMFDPATRFATLFTRDPRINWVDTMSIGSDGYLYFTVNQLNFLKSMYIGTGAPLVDHRQKPYVLFRKRLPNGGTKIT